VKLYHVFSSTNKTVGVCVCVKCGTQDKYEKYPEYFSWETWR